MLPCLHDRRLALTNSRSGSLDCVNICAQILVVGPRMIVGAGSTRVIVTVTIVVIHKLDGNRISRSGGCTIQYSRHQRSEQQFVRQTAGENISLGGGAATTTPTDIEIRQNHLFKPMTWMVGQPGFVGGVDGNPFIVKNHFELKNAQRVLFEGNIAENTWGGFSQTGYSLLLTPKNQSLRGKNVCPTCFVTDVAIRYNKISHAAAEMQIATVLSDSGPSTTSMRLPIGEKVLFSRVRTMIQ